MGAARPPALFPRDRPASSADPLPADALLHPAALAALGVFLLNDHVLKAAWPGPLTDKVSDLAGLIFFPLLLLSGAELTLALLGRWRRPTTRAIGVAVAVAAIGFGLSKTTPIAAEGSGWLLGIAHWLLSLPIGVVAGSAISPLKPAIVVADPTDLVALPCLAIALWIGISRVRMVTQVDPGSTPTRRIR
jgi:hypothetical protein